MTNTNVRRITPLAFALLFTLTLISMSILAINRASAASLSQVLVRFDRMMISSPTTGTVCAKPASAGTVAKVQVTYPAGYTLGAAATFTTTTTNLAWPAGAVAWPGIGTASTVTAQSVTFPSGSLTVGTLYCFNWSNSAAVSISSSASSSNSGSVATQTAASATIDSSSFSTASITADQIAVSASVPQSFSFALSGTTDNLGTLSSGSVSSSPTPRTATISTNAKNGWNIWASDANTGLNSVSAGATIASTTPGSNSTLAAGTAGYNTGVTSTPGVGGSGTITVAAPFVGGSVGKGGGLNTTLQSLATSNGTANGDVLTLTNNAAINATTAAATDYADTITVVGAGLF